MENFIAVVLIFTVLIGSAMGISSSITSTSDKIVIAHCKEKGVHYYGQTKMICKIEE